ARTRQRQVATEIALRRRYHPEAIDIDAAVAGDVAEQDGARLRVEGQRVTADVETSAHQNHVVQALIAEQLQASVFSHDGHALGVGEHAGRTAEGERAFEHTNDTREVFRPAHGERALAKLFDET